MVDGSHAIDHIDDEQQLVFSRNFGPLVDGANSGARDSELRLPVVFADVSNLDKDNKPLARDDRRRFFNLGNRLWHSDSSYRAVPAKYSLLSGRVVVTKGGNTEFADMRAAYDALDRSAAQYRSTVLNAFANVANVLAALQLDAFEG